MKAASNGNLRTFHRKQIKEYLSLDSPVYSKEAGLRASALGWGSCLNAGKIDVLKNNFSAILSKSFYAKFYDQMTKKALSSYVGVIFLKNQQSVFDYISPTFNKLNLILSEKLQKVISSVDYLHADLRSYYDRINKILAGWMDKVDTPEYKKLRAGCGETCDGGSTCPTECEPGGC